MFRRKLILPKKNTETFFLWGPRQTGKTTLLRQAYDLLREKLHFVYVGNAYLPGTDDTECPSCGQKVLERMGYQVNTRGLSGTRCGYCDASLPIVN